MATKKARKNKTAPELQDVPTDSQGRPDIYVLKNEHGLSMKKSAEAAEVSFPAAHILLYEQEVEHNPELKIEGKGKKLAKALVAARKEGVRWERLAARSGLGIAEIKAIIADEEGVSVEDLKRKGSPKPPKPPKKGKGKGKKAETEAEPEIEDEIEDEEVEEVEEVDDDDDVENDVEDEDESDDDDDEIEVEVEVEDEEDEEEDEEEVPAPPKRRGRPKKA